MVQVIQGMEDTRFENFGKSIGQALGMKRERKRQEEERERLEGKEKKQSTLLQKLLLGEEEVAEGEEAMDYSDLNPNQLLKAYELQNKPAPGGLSGQAVPPQVSKRMREILEANKDLSSDELGIALDEANIPRTYSNSFIENRRRQDERSEQIKEKRFESDRSHESKRSLPYLNKVDENRESIQIKDQALYLMENAIDEGNQTFFSQDNLANFLGEFGEGLRTAKGAQLKTAQKEFLLGNIARAGARPNMYIEKQIIDMLAKTGRPDAANRTVVEAFKSEVALEKKKVALSDELAEKYQEELGYVPGNISSQVDKALKPYAREIQSRLAYKLRDIQEQEMGEEKLREIVGKKVTKGTALTINAARILLEKEGSKEAALKKARSLGYLIPSNEQYQEYNEL